MSNVKWKFLNSFFPLDLFVEICSVYCHVITIIFLAHGLHFCSYCDPSYTDSNSGFLLSSSSFLSSVRDACLWLRAVLEINQVVFISLCYMACLLLTAGLISTGNSRKKTTREEENPQPALHPEHLRFKDFTVWPRCSSCWPLTHKVVYLLHWTERGGQISQTKFPLSEKIRGLMNKQLNKADDEIQGSVLVSILLQSSMRMTNIV